jgi:PRTRC genetic system protein E
MFKELFELVRASGPLTMAVSADAPRGTMTVVVIPKPADAKDEPALATPLSLTATPEEFDAEFTTVLAGYRTQRLSLAEQVAATNEVLAAAREASGAERQQGCDDRDGQDACEARRSHCGSAGRSSGRRRPGRQRQRRSAGAGDWRRRGDRRDRRTGPGRCARSVRLRRATWLSKSPKSSGASATTA